MGEVGVELHHENPSECVCLRECMCWCLMRPEKGGRTLGAGVENTCEPPSEWAGIS